MAESHPARHAAKHPDHAPINPLCTTYGNFAVHENATGAIGVGTNIDDEILRQSNLPLASEAHLKLNKKLILATCAVGAVDAALGIPFGFPTPVIVMYGVVGGTGSAVALLVGRSQRKQQRERRDAKEVVQDRMIYIPSVDLPTRSEGLPDKIDLPEGAIEATTLISILRQLQVRHLSPEVQATYMTTQNGLNPAMVVKGALLGLEPQSRELFLEAVYDKVIAMNDLATALDRHAPLAATRTGAEELHRQTTELVGKLGTLAAKFVDLRAAEILPSAQALRDEATEAGMRTGANEAIAELEQPGLRPRRFSLVMGKWPKPAEQPSV